MKKNIKKMVVVMVLLAVADFAVGKPMIVAHRGASMIAPENTLASVKLAFEKNSDGSEVDVYLTKDKRIMVMHDKSTKRTCGGVDMTMVESDSADLRKLDAGSFKSEEYTGEKIPYLEEIIDVVPKGMKLFIEIKSDKAIVPYLKKLLDESDNIEDMVIIAFNLETSIACKKAMPKIPLYWLKSTAKDKETKKPIAYDESVIQTALDNNFEGINLKYDGLTKGFIDKAHKAGLKVFTWTVNDIDQAKKLARLAGVDGITTDCPGKIKSGLGI